MSTGGEHQGDQPYWEEYPIGWVGEVLRTASGVLLGFLIGLGVTFALILGIGLIVEETSLLVSGMFDQLGRASMVPLLIATPSAAVLWALSADIADLSTIRSIRRAAERGAPVQAVPHPYQVRVLVEPPLSRVMMALIFALIAVGLVLLALVILPFTEGSVDSYVPIGIVVSLVAGGGGALALLAVRRYRAGHARRLAPVARHWHQDVEARAWSSARSASGGRTAGRGRGAKARTRGRQDAEDADAVGGTERMRRIAGALDFGAIFVGNLAFMILVPALGMRCSTVPGSYAGQECEETYYSSGLVETLIASGFVVFAVGLILAVVLAVAGLVLEALASRIEGSRLRAALADPSAPRPAQPMLQRHTERRTPLAAVLAAALAGMLTLLSPALIALGTGAMEDVASLYEDADERFAAYVPLGQGGLALAILLLIAALALTAGAGILGRPLRNALTRRWPTLPAVKYESQGENKPSIPVPATTKPVLHTLLKDEKGAAGRTEREEG